MPPRTRQKEIEQQPDGIPVPDGGSAPDDSPTGGDIAEAAQTRGVLAQRNDMAMQTFVQWCTTRAETTDEDQYAIMASVVGEIMSSGNVAELMAERSPLHARDLIGKPLILYGFELREGDYEESIVGFYAAMTCGRPGSDETRIITCGGTKVLAKLMMLESFINDPNSDETYPQIFWFTAKETKKGYKVLDIVRPEIAE